MLRSLKYTEECLTVLSGLRPLATKEEAVAALSAAWNRNHPAPDYVEPPEVADNGGSAWYDLLDWEEARREAARNRWEAQKRAHGWQRDAFISEGLAFFHHRSAQ